MEGIEREADLHQRQTVTLVVEPAGAVLDKIQLISTDETVLTITRGDTHESGKDVTQLNCVIESKMEGEASVYAQTEDGSVKSEEILIQVVDREKLAQRQQNAEAVESAILAIGEVTLDRADAIAQARSLYDNSATDVLVLVGNYNLLVEAEQTLSLKQEEERARLAAEEEKRIAAERKLLHKKRRRNRDKKSRNRLSQKSPVKTIRLPHPAHPQIRNLQESSRLPAISQRATVCFTSKRVVMGIPTIHSTAPLAPDMRENKKFDPLEEAKKMGYKRCHEIGRAHV